MAKQIETSSMAAAQISKPAPQKTGRPQTTKAALDNPITPEIRAMLDRHVEANNFAEKNMDIKINKHADWTLIQLLLENDSKGRSTVVKHVIGVVGCSPGTVRQMFMRFHKHGYISAQEKIGRSELYQPTVKLKKFIAKWAQNNFSDR